jgi:peptide/nickel transport system substrate-binding protein
MLKIGRTAGTGARTIGALPAAVLLIAATACVPGATNSQVEPVTLKIGYGLAAGANANQGIRGVARSITLESLVKHARDGRTLPGLIESWSESSNGLIWSIRLRPSARFHDGKALDAAVVRRIIIEAKLPGALGPAVEDVAGIRTVSNRELEIVLRKRSTFLMEQLGEVQIEQPGSELSGTGPFYVTRQQDNEIEMRANASYDGGKVAIDRIVIEPYTSVRSAWADMLRGRVDMLYDVGVDSFDLLESSNDVKVFTFQTRYAHMVLNVQKPYLRDPAFRRQLNAAIDRDALVAGALGAHGTPADTAVWPHHWAYTADLPRFHYDPHPVAAGQARRRLTCMFNERAYEPLAIALQRQLQPIGVDLELKFVSDDQVLARLKTGDFDAFLADPLQGPTLAWPYEYWHSNAPFNYGRFSSAQVDSALDAIRHAADEASYTAGVAAFERAMAHDPPAIFLAWRERTRAVSTRFHVAGNPGEDVLLTLPRWRLAVDAPTAGGR